MSAGSRSQFVISIHEGKANEPFWPIQGNCPSRKEGGQFSWAAGKEEASFSRRPAMLRGLQVETSGLLSARPGCLGYFALLRYLGGDGECDCVGLPPT